MSDLQEFLEQLGYQKVELNLNEIAEHAQRAQLYPEYLKDRMSVPLEWRQKFDAISTLSHDKIIKPKDDEAFRFFLDEPESQI